MVCDVVPAGIVELFFVKHAKQALFEELQYEYASQIRVHYQQHPVTIYSVCPSWMRDTTAINKLLQM